MAKIKFSIVIPLAPDRNAEILQSLKNLDYEKQKYEIIVEKGLNPSENRNNGVKKAKGEIVAFLDDDAYIEKNILKVAEDFFEKYPEIDIVGGPQLTPLNQKGLGKVSGYAFESIFGGSGIRKRYKKSKLNLNANETSLTSSNLFCKKDVFKKIKFSPKLFPGEDPDFIEIAEKQGFKVSYYPDIFVYHKRRETIKELARQVFSYGKTRPKRENLIKTLKYPFFLIPSIFIIYLFVLLILNINLIIVSYATFPSQIIIIKEIGFVLSLPLLLYIIMNLFFSFFISLKKKDFISFFMLPIVFLVIHFSYGLGMLYGYIRK